MAQITHASLYQRLRDDALISRAVQYAQWTIPQLMADIDSTTDGRRVSVERDYQEMGALLVNNLASKLVRILFPTQTPFFQASASGELQNKAQEMGHSPDELRSMFSNMEIAANRRLFINSGYAALILALKHLIVTGGALIYRDSKAGTLTTYGLRSFVQRRDGTGKLLDVVLKENTVVEALPADTQASLRNKDAARFGRPEQPVARYTRIHRKMRGNTAGYEVTVQIDTIPVGTAAWYPEFLCPWIVPTWSLIPGENAGRGMVEDYAGGFARLSALSEASTLYSVETMRVLHLVSGGAGTDVDELASAESGEYIRGDASSVKAHEAGDANKLVAVEGQIETQFSRLARAFMYQGSTRNAERVTAYELQRDAQEAEYSLGGVYSTLSSGMQVPLANILMTEVSELALTGLITEELRADLTAGIPALGRSSDVQNLMLAAQEIAAVAPLTQVDKRVDINRVSDLVYAGRSIDPKSILLSPDAQKKNEQAQQAASNAEAGLLAGDTLSNQAKTITDLAGAQ